MSTDRVDQSCLRRSRTTVFAQVALIIVAATVVTALAVSARVWTKSPTDSAPLTTAAARNKPQNNREPAPYHVELITLRPQGFVPGEITRPAGRFMIGIDNRTGLKDVEIRLIRETRIKEHEVRISRNKPDWRGVVNLAPGNYELREANHPEWVCRITLTAN